jgi:hypothetical protein
MQRKAFILAPFLVLFTLITGLISGIAINEYRVKRELMSAQTLDIFSLVEIETFKRIKSQFITFKPVDFTYEIGEWAISVHFNDETANILYEGPESIQASLNYDMVMENVLDYEIITEETSDSD